MNIIKSDCARRMTKSEAADALGIKTYDTALPQPWIDDVALKISSLGAIKKEDIYDLFLRTIVWVYDNKSLFGYPYPLTIESFSYLKSYDMNFGSHYCDEVEFQFNVLDI